MITTSVELNFHVTSAEIISHSAQLSPTKLFPGKPAKFYLFAGETEALSVKGAYQASASNRQRRRVNRFVNSYHDSKIVKLTLKSWKKMRIW